MPPLRQICSCGQVVTVCPLEQMLQIDCLNDVCDEGKREKIKPIINISIVLLFFATCTTVLLVQP